MFLFLTSLALASDPSVFINETLDNGLQVSILEDPRMTVVATQHWVHVGSAQEGERERGFAHLFEHLMFGATELHDKTAYGRLHTDHGGRENAYTSFDETVYVSEIGPEAHDQVLVLEAERLQSLILSSENLENEQRIVKEELRVSTENDPFGRLFTDGLGKLLGDHPYAHSPVGTKEDIDSVDLELCRDFYQRYYRPDHIHLVVVGPVDAAATLERVRELYGHLEPSGIEAPVTPALTSWPLPQRLDLKEDIPPVHVSAIGYPLPATGTPDDAAIEMLIDLLSEGGIDPFHERHIRERHRALLGETVSERVKAGGGIAFYSVALPFRGRKRSLALVERTVQELGELDWLTEERLAAARRRALRRHLGGGWFASAVGERIGQAQWHYGSTDRAFDVQQRFEAVSVEDVRRVWDELIGQATPVKVTVRRGKSGGDS